MVRKPYLYPYKIRGIRIAILILAHKNASQLERLIDHLHSHFDVYVHIDKKSTLSLTTSKAVFVKNRRVYWGSYKQILATLELFKTAHQKKYDRYLLISGQDIPIKTNQEIIEFFKNNSSKQFLEFNALPIHWWSSEGGLERLKHYYLKSAHPFLQKVSARLVHWQKKFKLFPRKIEMNYFGGGNWMDLNNAAVEYILNYVNSHPSYLRRFRYTHCADEIFFQTILLNSDLSNTCENKILRYFNWSKGPEYPRTLRKDDLEDILRSDALFARKFDETVDAEIISTIYAKIKS